MYFIIIINDYYNKSSAKDWAHTPLSEPYSPSMMMMLTFTVNEPPYSMLAYSMSTYITYIIPTFSNLSKDDADLNSQWATILHVSLLHVSLLHVNLYYLCDLNIFKFV